MSESASPLNTPAADAVETPFTVRWMLAHEPVAVFEEAARWFAKTLEERTHSGMRVRVMTASENSTVTVSNEPLPVTFLSFGVVTSAPMVNVDSELVTVAPGMETTARYLAPLSEAVSGPTETEVSLKYKVDTREFAGEAQFVQDQAGKRYLKSLQISYDSCEFKLPLAVK